MINVQGVSFAYRPDCPVLQNVSLHVERGAFVGIIGANGSGKSTLMKLILHQREATSGSISLFGEDVRTFRNWARLGFVPQNHHYAGAAFPATVSEMLLANMFPQIGLFHFVRRQHRERMRETLRLVDMEPYADSLIGTLSGGQLQRVLIARALVNHPELLLLDEPTNGVDVDSTQALYDLLQRLNQDQHLTILMITHDLSRAAHYLKQVFCLEEGNLLELPHNQLMHELAHRHRHPGGTAPCGCDISECETCESRDACESQSEYRHACHGHDHHGHDHCCHEHDGHEHGIHTHDCHVHEPTEHQP